MCLFPWRASLPKEGGRPKRDTEGTLRLPCGYCYECISKRAMEFALRTRHELSMHKDACFLSLTYDDENLPGIYVVKELFQDFIRALRKKLKKSKKELRYLVSHEYGGQTYRPHHHVILFGYNPSDQKYFGKSPKGYPLYISEELKNLWKHGFHSIGEANEKTAYYIASYALKGKKFTHVDEHGEVHEFADDMDLSKNPGIGLEYLKKNYKAMINGDELMPRYYLKKLAVIDPDALATYEDRMACKNLDRSSQQLLSKYDISNSKLDMSPSIYRINRLDKQTQRSLRSILKYNRDNYVREIKEKK